jgi:hypothetical protein
MAEDMFQLESVRSLFVSRCETGGVIVTTVNCHFAGELVECLESHFPDMVSRGEDENLGAERSYRGEWSSIPSGERGTFSVSGGQQVQAGRGACWPANLCHCKGGRRVS